MSLILFETLGEDLKAARKALGLSRRTLAEQVNIDQRYLALKNEGKEAEQIHKSVYSILRQEQRERQPHRVQGMEY